MTNILLHNTLSGEKEKFVPIEPGKVSMYNCGPTVYGPQHIGNLSMFVFTDILRRTFEYNGLRVKQVVNITDIGHLSGDNEGNADLGEDRMTKGLKRDGMDLTLENMKVMGKKYADLWKEDLGKLNIELTDTDFPFASDFVLEQIDFVKRL
jgi:cysteinyl-tRNA synthetase